WTANATRSLGDALGAVVSASTVGGPTVLVAVNVTGAMPETLVTVTVIVFAPSAEPSVQLPTVATPELFVVRVAPVADPPAHATANNTVAPLTAFTPSVTFTDGRTLTAPPPAGA